MKAHANEKTLSKTGAAVAALTVLLVSWFVSATGPASTAEAYPPPGAEPTCRPWAPDYPDPCHEHGGPWDPLDEFYYVYMPAIMR
ncbi:MAG: hypothetical protein ACOYYS_10205 [Chloroflexota bacterium]